MLKLLLHPNPMCKKPKSAIQLQSTYISLINKLNLLYFAPSLFISLHLWKYVFWVQD